MYFGALVLYEGRVHFGAPESLSESILASEDRSCSHASPLRFFVEAVAQHHDLSLTVPACRNDNAVAFERIRLMDEMGMGWALAPQRCRTRRREKGLDIQIENGARISARR